MAITVRPENSPLSDVGGPKELVNHRAFNSAFRFASYSSWEIAPARSALDREGIRLLREARQIGR